jgi:hypothetical protein
MKEIKQKMTGRMTLLFFSVILSFSAQCQELQKMETILSQGASSSSHSLEELVYGMVPSAKFNSTGLVDIDETGSPIRLFVTADEFSDLYVSDELFNSVQLIFIQVNDQNDLDQVLDLNQLSGFSSLEYIYFSLSFKPCGETGSDNCDQRKVSLMTTGEAPQGVSLLFNAEYNN